MRINLTVLASCCLVADRDIRPANVLMVRLIVSIRLALSVFVRLWTPLKICLPPTATVT